MCFANSKFTEEGSEFVVESEWDPMDFVGRVLKREKRNSIPEDTVCAEPGAGSKLSNKLTRVSGTVGTGEKAELMYPSATR